MNHEAEKAKCFHELVGQVANENKREANAKKKDETEVAA